MPRPVDYITFSVTNAAVGSSFEDLERNSSAEILTEGVYSRLGFEIENTGANLSDLSLMVKFHKDGAWQNYITGAEWAVSTVLAPLIQASAALNTLATGSPGLGWAFLNLPPCYSIKFQGKCGTSTDLTVRGTIWR